MRIPGKCRIQNEEIRLKIGVASIDEGMRASRLSFFGHVKRRASNEPVRE